MLNKQLYLYFPKLPSFPRSDDKFLSYLTHKKKCAFLEILQKVPHFKVGQFKNYPSNLDNLDIFLKYWSNYVYIAYSRPLQITCVDVEAASIKKNVWPHDFCHFQPCTWGLTPPPPPPLLNTTRSIGIALGLNNLKNWRFDPTPLYYTFT